MLLIDIPGNKKIEAEHLVLDFNGTLAIDGKLIEGVKPILEFVENHLTIHIITADTFGTSRTELSGIRCTLKIIDPSFQDVQKEMYVIKLGNDKVIAIGNGMNDSLMLRSAILGIAVLQQEGISSKSLMNADVICTSIIDALEMLVNSKRIVATLRK